MRKELKEELRASDSTEQPTTKGIPRVTSRDDDARDSPSQETKQLKASIKRNLYKVAESCGIYL